MILEKSNDYGQTWTPLQYYADDCTTLLSDPNIYRKDEIGEGSAISRVICTSEYSNQLPYVGGVVVFDVVEDRYINYLGTDKNDYKRLHEVGFENGLGDFLLFTDLRINLILPAMEDARDERSLLKYYYAISDINIVAGYVCTDSYFLAIINIIINIFVR